MSPSIFLRNCGVDQRNPRSVLPPYRRAIQRMMEAMQVGDPEKIIVMQSVEWQEAMEDYVRNDLKVREWLGLRTGE